ncbi:CBS domain-containing protein [Streptomyces sp. NPDC001388]|uniref:CBS domain-containing protein n=1 Tax=Streptomyces sp. NPDC001388 TaxID=3364568 RepID=UPI0036BE6FEC
MPYLVSDVMTRTVVALREGAAFKDIARTMRRWKVSALPVLDGDHRVIGVVSEADLLPKEMLRDPDGDPDRHGRPSGGSGLAKADAVCAEDLMNAPAVTVRADETVARAARVMARHRLKRLPVVDGEGVLQGIVSRTDLLKVFLREDADIAEEVRRDVVPRLFAVPVEPIRVEVRDGVVTLTGRVRDTSLVPVVTRMVRAVEGVVDVDCALSGPPRRPDLDPDLPDDAPTARADGAGAGTVV